MQDLYLQDGALPASAARVSHGKHHRKLPPAVLIARGTASTSTAATVTVVLHLTKQGRERLRSMKGVHVVLITTLRSSGGASVTLSRRALWLNR